MTLQNSQTPETNKQSKGKPQAEGPQGAVMVSSLLDKNTSLLPI